MRVAFIALLVMAVLIALVGKAADNQHKENQQTNTLSIESPRSVEDPSAECIVNGFGNVLCDEERDAYCQMLEENTYGTRALAQLYEECYGQ